MINDYYASIEELHHSHSLDELKLSCDQLLGELGIQYYKYQWQPSSYVIKSGTQTIVACPEPWMRHYRQQGFADADPKLAYAQHYPLPRVWTPAIADQPMTPLERSFWQHSVDFGLGHGATIPIRSGLGGRGMLCVALPEQDAEREWTLDQLPRVEALASHLQIAVERLLAEARAPMPALTGRESEVVKWTASGKTAVEIGMILDISETTTLFHLKNAKRKLNVVNKHQLTARALALGLL